MRDGEHRHDQGDIQGKHNHKKLAGIILLAVIFAIVAYSISQLALSIANINNVYAPVPNNTDLGYGGMGTGSEERQPFVTYWANESPIDVYLIGHIVGTGGKEMFEFNLSINGTVVQETLRDRTITLGLHERFPMKATVPKGANYSVGNNTNVFDIEWREYPILSGKNGTLSINQTVMSNGSEIAALQVNDTYFNGTIFPVSTDFRNNTMYDLFMSGKVNKTGDNMTGRLCINNCTSATSGELMVIEKAGDSVLSFAALRLETNNSQGNIFFGARYNGNRSDNMTNVTKGNILFKLVGIGVKVNNTYSNSVAEVRMIAADNFTNTKTPGEIQFLTVSNITTTSLTRKWFIEANGSFIPGFNNQFEIGNDALKVKNLSISLVAEGATLDAVCYDGTKLFYNPGLSTCTASRTLAKNNITNASYDPFKLNDFQLITYDYIVRYPHVDEKNDSVSYTERTVKRYGLTAEQVEAIDPLLVGHDEFGNPTGVHYEDLSAYLLNVTQNQQNKIDNICLNMPSLCSNNPGILAKAYDSLKYVFA